MLPALLLSPLCGVSLNELNQSRLFQVCLSRQQLNYREILLNPKYDRRHVLSPSYAVCNRGDRRKPSSPRQAALALLFNPSPPAARETAHASRKPGVDVFGEALVVSVDGVVAQFRHIDPKGIVADERVLERRLETGARRRADGVVLLFEEGLEHLSAQLESDFESLNAGIPHDGIFRQRVRFFQAGDRR